MGPVQDLFPQEFDTMYLPCISHVSPMYLPCISHVSPVYLPQEFDTMPRSRDEAFEALVAEAALEEHLQPEASFVENVVDLQDLLEM